MIAVTVDDHAGQTVALAPDQPAEPQIRSSRRARYSIACAIRRWKKSRSRSCFRRENRRATICDLRIVNRAPDEVIPAVLERDDIAIVRRAEHLQDFAAEYPVVSVKNARARFDDESRPWCSYVIGQKSKERRFVSRRSGLNRRSL